MNISLSQERFFDYAIAIEVEKALFDFHENHVSAERPPEIVFTRGEDPLLDLSIVVPVWNPGERQFERCLKSIREADFQGLSYEVVVSDDASPTPRVEAILKAEQISNAFYIRQEKNLGGFGNFNFCIGSARGRWVHMLHQDDWVEKSFYQDLIRGEAENIVAPLRFCRTKLFYEDVGETRVMFEEAEKAGVIPQFIKRQCISQRLQISGTIFARKELAEIGGFDARLGTGADWEYWARWASKYPVFHSPKQSATYTLHAGSWSTRATAGSKTADSLAEHRYVLQRILALLDRDMRQYAAQGFYKNLYGRFFNAAMENIKRKSFIENRKLINALFPGCVAHGFSGDIEKLLLTIK